MDSVIELSKIEEELLVGKFIKKEIESIYILVNEKNLEALTFALSTLRNKLIDHCNESKISLNNYPYEETAKDYFSQFLQLFFSSVLKMDFESIYKKQILNHILTIHKSNFYYQFYFNKQKKFILGGQSYGRHSVNHCFTKKRQ